MSFSFDNEYMLHNYEDNMISLTEDQTSQELNFNSDSLYYFIEPIYQDIYLEKKRRKKYENTKRPPHDKYARDNIKRKIQVHYLKFLRNLINLIIYKIVDKDKNIQNYQFYPLNYKYTQNITKNSFNYLKKSKIGDIFKNNVSPKYKNYKKLNINVYKEVTKNPIIKNILDKKYLEFIYLYYYCKNSLELKNYGLNVTINLPYNLGYFMDLINESDNIYIEKTKKCIENDFLPKSIFMISKNLKIDLDNF